MPPMPENRGNSASSIDHLLEPSLSPLQGQELYSLQASFMVAFFGGGLASVLFTSLNSRRLDRLSKDLPLLLLGGAFFVALTVWTGTLTVPGAALPFEGDLQANSRLMRIVSRGLALVFFGLGFLAHRRFHSAAKLSGSAHAKPWKPALACVGVSIGASFLLVLVGHGIG